MASAQHGKADPSAADGQPAFGAAYGEDVPYSVVETPVSTEAARADWWDTGAALQNVDGLSVSPYAEQAAQHYIEGSYGPEELVADIENHYADGAHESRQREADIVSARIAGLLERGSFSLRPAQLFGIHSALFSGVLPDEWVGRARTVNLEKAEPVLGGRSVTYADRAMIAAQLEYDFGLEKTHRYDMLLDTAGLAHLARFIANVWQTHPFREGNTRTIAVFSELYLRTLGVQVDNAPFKDDSVLFRDALVRANFSDIQLGIDEDLSFLTAFLENVVLGAGHDLTALDLNLHGVRLDDSTPYRPTGSSAGK